jgi:hypothetical protein
MSQYVNVASLMFDGALLHGESKREAILLWTKEKMRSLQGYGLDLVVFSEAMLSAQSLDQAEELDNPGEILRLYMDFAKKVKCHVAGAFRCLEDGNIYNSLVFIGPNGAPLGVYHKVNLTVRAIDNGETSGSSAVLVDTPIGRLGGVICFDLNFEELRQEYRALKPDILCFSSMYHGGLMQEMWAYDCRSFFVSSLPFPGCGILDPFGRPLKLSDCYTSAPMAKINLDRAMVHLDFNRAKFPEIEKKYLGEVAIDIPPNIAPALIYSLTDKRSAMDIVKEFELELLDDYLDRSLKANAANRA